MVSGMGEKIIKVNGEYGEYGEKRGHAIVLNRVVMVGLSEETLRRLRQSLEGGEGVNLEETWERVSTAEVTITKAQCVRVGMCVTDRLENQQKCQCDWNWMIKGRVVGEKFREVMDARWCTVVWEFVFSSELVVANLFPPLFSFGESFIS